MIDNRWDNLFNFAGEKYNVDPALLRTIFRNESSENVNTKASSSGALGGMQFLPNTAKAYGISDPTDMRQAIPAAAIYIRKGLDTYGTPEGALASYHGGFDTSQWGPKTTAYVAKGIANYPQVKADMAKSLASQAAPQAQEDDPDVTAGAKIMNGTPAPTQAQPQDDPDVTAGAKILANTPEPEPAKPEPVMSPEDAASMSMGGGAPANPPPVGASVPPTLPSQGAVESYLNQPPAPGFTRSSLLPIAVNPDIHSMAGIQFDPRGPINALTGLIQSNSPQAVAQRGNITPEMAMTLLGGAASGGGLNPLARTMPTEAFAGPQISAAQAAASQASRDPIVAPLSPDFKANPLSPDLAARLNPPPNSVGAMGTPSSMVPALTPAEAATAEGRQFQQTAIDRQDSGQDRTVYVPDSKPTEGTMNPAASPTENALRNHDPAQFKKSDDLNNAARVQYLDNHTSDPIAIEQLTNARDAQATTDLAPMKADPQPVDLQPVKDIVARQLAEGGEDRGLVANTLNSVQKTLEDADGNLRTDPNRIYNGARKNITDMLERGKADPASNEATATAHLMEIKTALDQAISQNNPSFGTYLENYQKNSMPLDEATVLNNVRSKIVNGQGNMMLGALNNQLASIVKARAAQGANPAKSLTPDTMDMLFNLKADLQRKAYAESVNQGVGSNTVRQTLQAAKTGTLNPLIAGGLGLAADVATAHMMGPLGLIGRRVMAAGTNKLLERRTNKANQLLGNQVDQFINPQ